MNMVIGSGILRTVRSLGTRMWFSTSTRRTKTCRQRGAPWRMILG